MSRLNLEDSKIYDPILMNGIKGGVNVLTLAGTLTMDRDMPFLNFINPGGAIRNILLPPAERGLMFFFAHTGGAFDMTVKDSTNTTTYGTLSTTETGFAVSDGNVWVLGVMTTT